MGIGVKIDMANSVQEYSALVSPTVNLSTTVPANAVGPHGGDPGCVGLCATLVAASSTNFTYSARIEADLVDDSDMQSTFHFDPSINSQSIRTKSDLVSPSLGDNWYNLVAGIPPMLVAVMTPDRITAGTASTTAVGGPGGKGIPALITAPKANQKVTIPLVFMGYDGFKDSGNAKKHAYLIIEAKGDFGPTNGNSVGFQINYCTNNSSSFGLVNFTALEDPAKALAYTIGEWSKTTNFPNTTDWPFLVNAGYPQAPDGNHLDANNKGSLIDGGVQTGQGYELNLTNATSLGGGGNGESPPCFNVTLTGNGHWKITIPLVMSTF